MNSTIESTEARTVERLLGLEARSLHAVERRANGDFVLCFKHQCLDHRWRRTLRIPARRVAGYQRRYPGFAPPERDVRARRKRNARVLRVLADVEGRSRRTGGSVRVLGGLPGDDRRASRGDRRARRANRRRPRGQRGAGLTMTESATFTARDSAQRKHLLQVIGWALGWEPWVQHVIKHAYEGEDTSSYLYWFFHIGYRDGRRQGIDAAYGHVMGARRATWPPRARARAKRRKRAKR